MAKRKRKNGMIGDVGDIGMGLVGVGVGLGVGGAVLGKAGAPAGVSSALSITAGFVPIATTGALGLVAVKGIRRLGKAAKRKKTKKIGVYGL